MTLFDFFTDPLYRAPFLGSMLMCFASSLMGTLMFVKRRSLLGESLSHATYPGIVLSGLFGAMLLKPNSLQALFLFLGGAALFAYLGLEAIEKLRNRLKIHFDAALCLILSLSLGLGVVFASRMQFTSPLWYQQTQTFLYGQAATMNDVHILIYGTFACLITLFILFRYREIELSLFDRDFGKGLGMPLLKIYRLIFLFLILSIVVGIRSVGVVLMAGMLIAPAAAARCFTDRLSLLLPLSVLFGVVSGFGGNYLSVKFSASGFHLPTGPMILLLAVSLTLLSLIFAPKRGIVSRLIRMNRFRRRCQSENILKTLWKGGKETPLTHQEVLKWNAMGPVRFQAALFKLQREGWISRQGRKKVILTPDGVKKAEHLIRLHRLWELYLVSCLKADEKRVHYSAEEIEHILTPSLEARLSSLLNDPKTDPHQKPIPRGDES